MGCCNRTGGYAENISGFFIIWKFVLHKKVEVLIRQLFLSKLVQLQDILAQVDLFSPKWITYFRQTALANKP